MREYPRQDSNTIKNPRELRAFSEDALHNPVQLQSIDPELQRLIDVWPTLSEGVRTAIVVMTK